MQMAATLAASGQTLQQCGAFSHCAACLMRLGMNVSVDAGLVGLVGCPVDETWMVIRKKHRPLGQGQMTGSSAEPALFIDVSLMAALSVGICASIYRIGEHMMDGGIRRSDPADLTVHGGAQREGKPFGTKPEPDLAGRSHFRKLREHRANSADHSLVRMEADFTVLFAPHETHGQSTAQFAARGLVADSAIKPGAQDMKFRFRHCPFQAEDQAIVEKSRMIDPVAISNQRIRHAAQIEQTIPVGVVARETGDFESEHDAHVAQRHFRGHAGESGALHRSGAGKAKVFINDDHLFLGPPQFAGPFHQSILTRRRLPVVLHLRRAGLADIDKCRAPRMTELYLSGFIHGPSPRRGVGRRWRSAVPGCRWPEAVAWPAGLPRDRFRREADRRDSDGFSARGLSSTASLVMAARRLRRASVIARV